MLVRRSSLRKSNDGKEWLLIKERDDSAQKSTVGGKSRRKAGTHGMPSSRIDQTVINSSR